jgi:hypothetical protein
MASAPWSPGSGGAIVVQYFRLQEWVTGLVAVGGLICDCRGRRWVFNFIRKNRYAGIDEVAKKMKEML